eukprot:3056644-Pleurochrysis_carterae.AAC.3
MGRQGQAAWGKSAHLRNRLRACTATTVAARTIVTTAPAARTTPTGTVAARTAAATVADNIANAAISLSRRLVDNRVGSVVLVANLLIVEPGPATARCATRSRRADLRFRNDCRALSVKATRACREMGACVSDHRGMRVTLTYCERAHSFESEQWRRRQWRRQRGRAMSVAASKRH